MPHDPMLSEEIRDAAAAWFARMRRPDAELFKNDFETWLATSPEHRSAYNRVAETFSLGRNLTTDLGLNEGTIPTPRRAARRGELLLVALSIMLGGAFAVALWSERAGFPLAPDATRKATASSMVLVTAAKQLKSVRLADGSLVTLDASSRLKVAFSSDIRAFQLEQGRARFNVAHEPRPFTVTAGANMITAHGTIFDVAVQDQGPVVVKLMQGSVEVVTRAAARTDAPVSSRRKLVPGQELTTSSLTSSASIRPLVDDGWMQAPIDYDNARLADIITQANLNARRPIRLAGGELGELKVSGTFRISDTAQLARRLATLFSLVDEPHGSSEILLRRP